jgi:hypothetical protein
MNLVPHSDLHAARPAGESRPQTQPAGESRPRARSAWFAPLPREGFWTPLGLGRGQFFGILLASCAIFTLWGGPLWWHLREPHFGRLIVSYLLIPILVLAALLRNGRCRAGLFLGATVVLALLKLVLTAGLDLVLGIALGTR